MTRLTVDDAVAARLRAADEIVELVDSQGNFLGLFDSEANFDRLIKRVPSPFSRRETEEHRKQTAGGITLSEVLSRLRSNT